MSNGHIKIDISDSNPIISMEYSDLDVFKDLIFFISSPSGLNLFCKTIEKDLTLNNKIEELQILKAIIEYINPNNNIEDDDNCINPSSFK